MDSQGEKRNIHCHQRRHTKAGDGVRYCCLGLKEDTMRAHIHRSRLLIAAVVLAGVLNPGVLISGEVNLSFDHFYDHAELTKALQALEKAYPQMATLQSIGKPYGGR